MVETRQPVPPLSGDDKRSQRLLQDSLHEGASEAVASLLQRKLTPVAIRDASRLGRNQKAWDKKETSPFSLGVSILSPVASASATTIALFEWRVANEKLSTNSEHRFSATRSYPRNDRSIRAPWATTFPWIYERVSAHQGLAAYCHNTNQKAQNAPFWTRRQEPESTLHRAKPRAFLGPLNKPFSGLTCSGPFLEQ